MICPICKDELDERKYDYYHKQCNFSIVKSGLDKIPLWWVNCKKCNECHVSNKKDKCMECK